MGELDVIIEGENGEFLTFYEGMNLEYLNKSTITSHIEKIINKYDALGIPEKFLGSYCKTSDFDGLSSKYFEFLNRFDYNSINFSDVIDVTTDFSVHTEIRIFKSTYDKSGRKILLTHILIHLS